MLRQRCPGVTTKQRSSHTGKRTSGGKGVGPGVTLPSSGDCRSRSVSGCRSCSWLPWLGAMTDTLKV